MEQRVCRTGRRGFRIAGLSPVEFEGRDGSRLQLFEPRAAPPAIVQKRKRLASPRAPSYSYFNRREAERLRRVPLAQLRADLDATYRELMALLSTLTDDELKKSFSPLWWNSNYHPTLRAIMRENAEHLRIHATDVKNWREREHVGK
jgi:hypothetical protein